MNIVLMEPEIPYNTGNIGRSCVLTNTTLHLIKPLGFSLDEKQIKRSGLDYWELIDLKVWESYEELRAAYPESNFYLSGLWLCYQLSSSLVALVFISQQCLY